MIDPEPMEEITQKTGNLEDQIFYLWAIVSWLYIKDFIFYLIWLSCQYLMMPIVMLILKVIF